MLMTMTQLFQLCTKKPIGSRFIVASETCSTNQLSNIVSKVFKMIYNHVENFYNKNQF